MNDTRLIVYNGHPVFYVKKGKGPLVMLLHGFGEDGTIWDSFLSLSENYTLIIPDLPGSGKSPFFPVENEMKGYATVIHQIVLQEKAEKMLLIGHSMGGYISLAFAEQYPGILSGIGMFHSSALADSEDKKDTRTKAIRLMETYGPMALLNKAIPGLFFDKEKHKLEITVLLKKGQDFSAAALINYYRSMKDRPDRTKVLASLKLPLLWIAGKYDEAVPLESSLQQTYLADKTYIHILKQSGHMGMIEENNLSLNYVSKFLEEIG